MANEKRGRKAEVVEITASDARNNLSEFLNRAEFGGERIKIIRHGKTIAALIGVSDFERLNAA